MKLSGISLTALRIRLALARFGWLKLTALLMLITAAVFWWRGIGYLQLQVNEPLRSLQRAQQQLQSNVGNPNDLRPSSLEQRLAAFHHVLGDVRYAEQQVKTLFAVADKSKLVLSQAEYRAAFDRNARITTYQVLLPVKGSYAAIRQFCEQTLLAIPFASLDEISFKREAISSQAVEAKLRFTLYLADSKPSRPAVVAKGEQQ